MKTYFTRLFQYDQYVNNLITDAIVAASQPQETEKLMAHMLGAQQIWLSRCKGENILSGPIWPDWKADTFKQIIADNHNAWMSFLATQTDDDFDRKITYRDMKGNEFSSRLSDMITQVTNHGTHHRAQIGQLLKEDSINLPITDYIFYIRQQN